MFKHQRPIKWLRCHLETRPRRTPQETLCQNCASIFTWRSRIQHRADLFTEDTASYVAMTYGYWWEELETSVDLEGDYTPRAYDTSKGVEFNHNILAGGRSKQFDVSDQSYGEPSILGQARPAADTCNPRSVAISLPPITDPLGVSFAQ